MKTSYDIEKEMEKRFGKDFINKMKSQKEEYERMQKDLEDAKTFEEKVNEKETELRKNFIHISDDLNIYPDETCYSYLSTYAERCVEENLTKKECQELQEEYEFKVIDALQEDIDLLQKEIDAHKEAWKEDEE